MINGSLYVVFVALFWLGVEPAVTAAPCYAMGLTLSYVLNRRWSFESTSGHTRDLPRFLLSCGSGFSVTIGFILVLTRWMRPELAQILSIGLTALVIYGCVRLTGFGQSASP